jgi:hypothetical protein
MPADSLKPAIAVSREKEIFRGEVADTATSPFFVCTV